MRRIMYKVYVRKCIVGQDMKPASQPVTFFSFFLLFGRRKRSSYVKTYQKSEKKVHCENKNSLFLCHKCNILPSYLS